MTTVIIGQNDQFQGHAHSLGGVIGSGATTKDRDPRIGSYFGIINNTGSPISDGTNGTPRIGSETRSKNITIKYWKRVA